MITTKSGIRIGAAYFRPPPLPSPDAELIQCALLGARPSLGERLLDVLDANWSIAFAVAVLVGSLVAIADQVLR